MSELDTKIEKALKHLENLRNQKLQEESSEPKYLLARLLHKKLCYHSHDDACGWFYHVNNGVDNWSEYSHKEYLSKAVRMLTVANGNHKVVLDIIETL